MSQTKALKYFLINVFQFFFVYFVFGQPVGLSQVYSQLYEFDPNGSSSNLTFYLVWDTANDAINGIDIFNKDTKEKVQTIDLKIEGLKIDTKQLVAHGRLKDAREFRDKILEMVDYNFDSFGDLRILREFPIEPGNKRYSIYLFNPKKKLFSRHRELSDLTNPTPLNKGGKRQIESEEMTDKAKGVFHKKVFTIDKWDSLKLDYRIEQSTIDPKANVAEFKVSEKRATGFIEVCRWRRSTEGNIHIVAGKRIGCKSYLQDIAYW